MAELDLSGITIGEMTDLALALGCKDTKEAQGRLRALHQQSQETGSVPIDALIPFVWIAARQSRPGLTLAQARDLPMNDVNALFPAPAPVKAKGSPTRARK